MAGWIINGLMDYFKQVEMAFQHLHNISFQDWQIWHHRYVLLFKHLKIQVYSLLPAHDLYLKYFAVVHWFFLHLWRYIYIYLSIYLYIYTLTHTYTYIYMFSYIYIYTIYIYSWYRILLNCPLEKEELGLPFNLYHI